jgi:hypothetical protein
MHDTITTLVAPGARQGGTTDDPSGGVRLARGLDAPTTRTRHARGLNPPPRARSASLEGSTPPRARSASLEGTYTHVIPALAPVYGHLMLRHRRTRATTLTRLGIASRCCSTDSLGEAIPATV